MKPEASAFEPDALIPIPPSPHPPIPTPPHPDVRMSLTKVHSIGQPILA
ncbi:hypothetical protein [Fortiea contorta]|nr:hypothetical protein [Fortiea contorta]